MKIVVAGSRDWTDKYLIYDSMYFLYMLARWHRQPFIVAHGAGRGADSIFDRLAKRYASDIRTYPADWEKYGRLAGPKRIEEMWFAEHWIPVNAPHPKRLVQEPVDLCVTYWLEGAHNRGTSICAGYAEEHQVPVWRIPSKASLLPDLPEEFRSWHPCR